MGAVPAELGDALEDVGAGGVGGALAGRGGVQRGVVAGADLGERGDVDDAVGQVGDDGGEVAQHEQAVHVHAVAGEHGAAGAGDETADVGEQLCLDLRGGLGAGQRARGEAAGAVVLGAPGVHGGERGGGGVHDALVAVVDGVEVPVGDEAADLDDVVRGVVEAGHLAVDPDDGLVELAGREVGVGAARGAREADAAELAAQAKHTGVLVRGRLRSRGKISLRRRRAPALAAAGVWGPAGGGSAPALRVACGRAAPFSTAFVARTQKRGLCRHKVQRMLHRGATQRLASKKRGRA